MLIKLMVRLEKLTGVVLEGVAVSVQLGNVMICILVLLLRADVRDRSCNYMMDIPFASAD
jgi:hypothetical protein